MEIEYWRNRYQRMNKERFFAANTMALITHGLTQPFDLVKTRAQVMQEGKSFTGLGFQKGFQPGPMLEEIHRSGGGMRRFYTSLDGFVAKTMVYTTARIWSFLYFYDWLNPDPRRTARIDWNIMAATAGGLVAGVLFNPVDLVFTRMQIDGMYPEGCRRNYKNIVDGLMRVVDEGTLFRGSAANGLKIAALCGSMTGVNDWCKENSYYWFGPSWMNRIFGTATAVAVGVAVSLPFDCIRTRLHQMRPLPNGVLPYNNTWDCFKKMATYEASTVH